MSEWVGKTVLVTGGGSGLGQALVLALVKEGANVAFCGRRAERLQDTAASAEGPGNALPIAADVSVPADAKRFVAEAVEAFGRIDALINNAAVFEAASLLETELDAWNEQFAVNVTGPLMLMQAVLPGMRLQGGGIIVNVTSGMASNGAGGYAAYGASKAALESLTRTSADEEEEHGIRVLLYNPGTIRSGMHATGENPHQVVPELLRRLA
ncbi:SDR family oxidoreductase [Paenibacillus sp. TRM 82003]|nr:SDR family oxidoreductase [Paenibacillus sp. TRM 82003]